MLSYNTATITLKIQDQSLDIPDTVSIKNKPPDTRGPPQTIHSQLTNKDYNYRERPKENHLVEVNPNF